MAKIQAYVSDEVAEKINAIVEKRKAEGAREKDVSFSSVSTMLVELGGNDSNLLIVFYVQIMPDDFVMQLHRF